LLGRSAILLKQLLSRVVFGGLFQPVDGGIALLVELGNVGVGVREAVVEVARKRIADKVDAARC